jgi:hypothetical protein
MFDVVISKKPTSVLLKRSAVGLLIWGAFSVTVARYQGVEYWEALGFMALPAFIAGFLGVLYVFEKDGEITAERQQAAELLARVGVRVEQPPRAHRWWEDLRDGYLLLCPGLRRWNRRERWAAVERQRAARAVESGVGRWGKASRRASDRVPLIRAALQYSPREGSREQCGIEREISETTQATRE